MQDVKTVLRFIAGTGGWSALIFVLIFTCVYAALFILANDTDTSEALAVLLLIVIPALAVILLSGALLVPILFLSEGHVSNAGASIVGAALGVVIALAIMYLIWWMFFRFMYYPASQYILPPSLLDLHWFVMNGNPMFLPCVIDVLALARFGWNANKLVTASD